MLRAELHAAFLRRKLSSPRAFDNQPALQFREQRHHVQHGFSERVGGVYLLRETLKLYASAAEVVESIHDIAHAAPEAVELPDCQRVAMLQLLEATLQGRAAKSRAASSFIDKCFAAACAFERGELHVRVLVVGGDAGVSVFHKRVPLREICGTM